MHDETRDDRLSAAWLAGMVLAQAGASLLSGAHAWGFVLLNALFWAGLCGYLARDRRAGGALWALVFAPIYWATFLANREGIARPDHVFNSDTFRYLAEAASHTIQARHIGFPAITFVGEGWERVGSALGVTGLGRESIQAQTALAGALTVAVFRRILGRLEIPGLPARAATATLAVSLAMWTFAAVVESYVFTALFVLLVVETLAFASPKRSVSPVSTALLTVAALGFSLENLFLPVIAVAALLVRGPSWRRAGLYALLTASLFGVWISSVAAVRGPGFYATWGDQAHQRPAASLPENLVHFAGETWDAARLLSPRAHAETAARTFVAAVAGRPGEPPWSYAKFLDRKGLATAPRLAWIASLVATAALAARGMRSAWRGGGPAGTALAVSAAILVVRHAFILAFSPREGILFALPSLAAGLLALAIGARAHPRAAAAAVGLGAAVAAAVNAIYLAQIATPGRF